MGTLETPCPYVPRPKDDPRPFIYGLVDPEDLKHVLYVGMAMRRHRPYDHAKEAAKNRKHNHLYCWIRSLQAQHREPSVLMLEELPAGTTMKLLGFVERCYIKSLREIGHRLVNVAEGGDGGNTGPASEETRRRRSKATKGRVLSQSHRDAIGNALRGHRKSVEHCAAMRAAKVGCVGHASTSATKAKISAANKGRPSPRKQYGPEPSPEFVEAQRVARISATLSGRSLTPEHREKIGIANALSGDQIGATLRATWALRKAADALLTPQERAQKKLDKLNARIAKLKTEIDNA